MDEFTLKPEYEYTEEMYFKTQQTPFLDGYVQKRAAWQIPKRRFRLVWYNALQSEKDYVLGFLRNQLGPAGQFYWQPCDPIPKPVYPGTMISVAGGSYGARTYYYNFTWKTAYGETEAGPEESLAIAANYLYQIYFPRFPRNVTECGFYLGTVSGNTQLQVYHTYPYTYRTEPVSGSPYSGSNPPTANTALEKVIVSVAEDLFTWRKRTPVSYGMELTFDEVI